MTRTAQVTVALAVFLGVCQVAAAEGETVRGVVVGTDAWKAENGQLMLSVTVKTEGIWQATFSVGPTNREAYTMVGSLKKGEPVVIGWTAGDGRNWIREIVRQGAAGEGERKEGERTEKREKAEGEERERVVRRDREGAERREPREGERREGERRENQRGSVRGTVVALDDQKGDDGRTVLTVTVAGEGDRRTVLRVGEGKRELFERAKRLKQGDRVAIGWVAEGEQKWIREIGRTEGEREGTERRERGEGERRERTERREGGEGERPERAEGERKEAAVREGKEQAENERRDWTRVTVVSVITPKPGDPRTLTVVRIDNGRPMTFKVPREREDLYEAVGKLLPGTRIVTVWAEHEGGPQLQKMEKVN